MTNTTFQTHSDSGPHFSSQEVLEELHELHRRDSDLSHSTWSYTNPRSDTLRQQIIWEIPELNGAS